MTFERDGNHLVNRDHRLCGFVPMQGLGTHHERVVALNGDEVHFDDYSAAEHTGVAHLGPELTRIRL